MFQARGFWRYVYAEALNIDGSVLGTSSYGETIVPPGMRQMLPAHQSGEEVDNVGFATGENVVVSQLPKSEL